jgi:sugar O-acyltransferase (sialic acid O-acetyltransferase NeuD family)
MILIGYSGHAFVVYGILKNAGIHVTGYCDNEEKKVNPFQLAYLGKESDTVAIEKIITSGYFISIGDNAIRKKVYTNLTAKIAILPYNAIHPASIIDTSATIENNGVMISAAAIINPLASIGKGVICNTGCIIEHECIINDFAHIAPGAVLCGNVTIGKQSFVGAGAIIRQGVTIGKNVIIGAGAVVLKDVADNKTVMGIPAK